MTNDKFNVVELPDGSIKIARDSSRSKDKGTVLFSLVSSIWDEFVSWHYKEYGGSFLSGGKELLTERIEKFLSMQ